MDTECQWRRMHARSRHCTNTRVRVTPRTEPGQPPGREHVLQIRAPRNLSPVILHLHHDHRTQHHLWHHRRHILRTERSQGKRGGHLSNKIK